MKYQFIDNDDDWMAVYAGGTAVWQGHTLGYGMLIDLMIEHGPMTLVERWGVESPEGLELLNRKGWFPRAWRDALRWYSPTRRDVHTWDGPMEGEA